MIDVATNHANIGLIAKRPLWRRWWFKDGFDETLFDWRSSDPQPSDWWKPGVLSSHVQVRVDWLDRLKLLISGKCQIDVYTRTDVIVRKCESRSTFTVLAPNDKLPS